MNAVHNEDQSFSKGIVTGNGLAGGLFGAILGVFPFEIGRMLLIDSVLERRVRVFLNAPTFSFDFVSGLPLPMLFACVVLPLGGIIMGIIGANIAVRMHLKKNWGSDRVKRVAFWWGFIFGFLLNLFFSFGGYQ